MRLIVIGGWFFVGVGVEEKTKSPGGLKAIRGKKIKGSKRQKHKRL
jgi:hypothetical protein